MVPFVNCFGVLHYQRELRIGRLAMDYGDCIDFDELRHLGT